MKAKLMGILNVTPDSFFDKGAYLSYEKAIQRAISIQKEGADIIDIGGESSRPGSEFVSENEEYDRVIPVIENLTTKLSIPISVDTRRPKIAEAALKAGASMINDISGFQDPEMRSLVAQRKAKICLMHMQGMPTTMQHNPYYPEGVITDLMKWFHKNINLLIESGVAETNIIIDPGIGFGKTVDDNLKIIHNLHMFKNLGFPVLLGVSRKSFMSKILNKPTGDLLYATLAMNTLALSQKVDILRVHDVKEHRDIIDLMGFEKEFE